MRGYRWAAIPEGTWTGFAAAFGGLVVVIMAAYGVDALLTGAVGVFIGAFFRLIIALISASVSEEGTVTIGTEPPVELVPPSSGSGVV